MRNTSYLSFCSLLLLPVFFHFSTTNAATTLAQAPFRKEKVTPLPLKSKSSPSLMPSSPRPKQSTPKPTSSLPASKAPLPEPLSSSRGTSARIRMVLPAIQKFKKRVTCDPQNITSTWNGNNVCNYAGFVCATVPNYGVIGIAGVDFNGKNLANCKGDGIFNLDGFIEELPDLVFFHANSNNFTGVIPSKISKLPYFSEFDLSNNKLTGKFPTAILHATKLTFLDLRFNFLTGSLPHQVFSLDLDVLFLNNNMLTGKIPRNLGQTTAAYLTLANNNFTGPLPRSIGQASNTMLEALFLNDSLTGCLPYEIGLLKKTTTLDVSINQLTGPIPESFGCLAKMQQLNMSYNQFYGIVPETVCKLPNLHKLSLKYNYFTQVGPECKKLIKRKVLDVSMNCIADLPSQRPPVDCATFFAKKPYCPNKRSFSYVPCQIAPQTPQDSLTNPLTSSLLQSLSYAALSKHISFKTTIAKEKPNNMWRKHQDYVKLTMKS